MHPRLTFARRRTVAALVLLALAAAASASAALQQHAASPRSLAVLGESDALGYGSDAAHPYRDAPANSWATGTNPAVESIYQRILATGPAVRGHAVNLARDDASVGDLAGQIRKALALTPKPDLLIVQPGEDVRCDGQDQARVTAFGTTLAKALAGISSSDPGAKVFVVSAWGSFSSYVAYLKGLTLDARLKHAGKGLCQMVASPSGAVVPSHVAYLAKVIYAYDAQLASVCKQVTNCRYDGGAAQRMSTGTADIAVDQGHLSLLGQKKLAAIEWPQIQKLIASS